MKAIIFDLGGVLIDLDMHQCFENIRALGVDLERILVKNGFLVIELDSGFNGWVSQGMPITKE